MSTLHLHHLENSRSFRILWLLEELGLDYNLTTYERAETGFAPTCLEQVHPTGKSPILEVVGQETVENDSQTLTLIESGHIIDYLMATYDSNFELHPQVDSKSRAWRDYNFWMHYAEASIMPALVMRLVFSKIVERSPKMVKPITKRVRNQIETSMISKNLAKSMSLVEQQLGDTKWFAGSEFSAADIQMFVVIKAANAGHRLDRATYTNTINWLKLVEARPAYQAAVAKGGAIEF